MGGRSRVAAQMLAGKGFKEVYNVAGGIRAWQSGTATGPENLGMDLFTGKEEPAEVLMVAYSLEQGLREFYITMGNKAENEDVKKLFGRLAAIEIKHQHSIYEAYEEFSGGRVDMDGFKKNVEIRALEGGLSTDEYLDLFKPDISSEADVISLAMSIEAQALDLYQRVSMKIESLEIRRIINRIAREEKMHLESLGRLMDSL